MQNVKLQFEKKNNDYRIREAFKTLRSNIEFCGGDVKVIAVTSCTPNEGKSSVAMEMARAFAEAGSEENYPPNPYRVLPWRFKA